MKSLLFFLFMCIWVSTEAQQNTFNQNPPYVELQGTQWQKFNSEILNQQFDLYVSLPRNYSDSARTFPVLYLIDGQWDFPLVYSIFGEQYYDGFVHEIIIASIAWGGNNPDYDYLRAKDLTPTNMSDRPQSGNAHNFLKFIKSELVPYIEKNYNVSADRALAGSSFGGLFTLYTLFTETDLFNRYMLTSPAIRWDNGVIYNYEKKYAETHSDLPVKLFMAIGGCERVEEYQKFVDVIKGRNYPGLEIESRVLEGIGHSGSKSEGYTRGLQFIYQKPDLKLDADILNKYAGDYEIQPGKNVKLAVKDGVLYAHMPENTEIRMHAISETEFYSLGVYGFANFHFNEEGFVTGFTFQQFDGKMELSKIR